MLPTTREPELVESQAPTAGNLAIFDLDRTLLPGSSLVPFARELVARRLLSPFEIGRHLLSARRFGGSGERVGQVAKLKRDLLAMAAGRDHAPLAEAAHDVGRMLAESMSPAARWLVDRHLTSGDFVVVVSASIHELVETVATEIGAHRGVGTRGEVLGGRLTGALRGPLCHGAGKLDRLCDELGDVDLSRAMAYSDSSSDLALLEAVATPVAVNPDRKLTDCAEARGWPILSIA